MQKIEFGKVITEESVHEGKINCVKKSIRNSYIVQDKWEAQSKMLEATKEISNGNTNDLTIQLIGDGNGSIKRMEITVVTEKTRENIALAKA